MHLGEYLFHKRIKQKDFATFINYDRVYLNEVKRGKKWPSDKLINIIIHATNGEITKEAMRKFYEETQSLKEINT